MSDLKHQILDALDAAEAREGGPTNLTTAELVDRLDADRATTEEALATLRFDEQRVLKGPDVADAGSEWRIVDQDDQDNHLATDT